MTLTPLTQSKLLALSIIKLSEPVDSFSFWKTGVIMLSIVALGHFVMVVL